MNKCLSLIKSKCKDKFRKPDDPDNFWSNQIKVNFISATLNKKIEALGSKLMESYVTVGFDTPGTSGALGEENLVAHIPK